MEMEQLSKAQHGHHQRARQRQSCTSQKEANPFPLSQNLLKSQSEEVNLHGQSILFTQITDLSILASIFSTALAITAPRCGAGRIQEKLQLQLLAKEV